MMKILNRSIALVFSLILLFYQTEASDYPFGSKVMSNDSDLGRLLKNMPDSTIISIWDIGTDIGSYDEGDVVYLDTPPIGIANANDVRLTSFNRYQAGTKVKPYHSDINAPLNQLLAEIRFLNLNGSQSYDIHDPVYVVQATMIYQNETIPSDRVQKNETSNPSPAGSSTAQASNIAEINSTDPEEVETSDGSSCTEGKPCLAQNDFYEHLSYKGSCEGLPQTSACLIYSDNYVWPVSDRLLSNMPSLVGFDNNGFPIEVISCYNANYYHILGTLLVKTEKKEKTLFIQSASDQGVSIMSSSLIRTNDIRLTPVNGMQPGSKVLNFEPDLNKLIALPVLVSFPKRAGDYACLRVFDANGNGLYDNEDSVYIDISLPFESGFGTVTINDIRLTGPSS